MKLQSYKFNVIASASTLVIRDNQAEWILGIKNGVSCEVNKETVSKINLGLNVRMVNDNLQDNVW
jgi:hypothetical protein